MIHNMAIQGLTSRITADPTESMHSNPPFLLAFFILCERRYTVSSMFCPASNDQDDFSEPISWTMSSLKPAIFKVSPCQASPDMHLMPTPCQTLGSAAAMSKDESVWTTSTKYPINWIKHGCIFDRMQQLAWIQSLPRSTVYQSLPFMTKNMVGRVLLSIFKSTQISPEMAIHLLRSQ